MEPGRRYRLRDGDLVGLVKVGEDFRVMFRFRETQATLAAIAVSSLIPAASLGMDLEARRMLADGRNIPLRRKEFDLLAFLYENRGKACSRNEIAQQVWADESGIVAEETIDTVVHRVREKIEADPSKLGFLVTYLGMGSGSTTSWHRLLRHACDSRRQLLLRPRELCCTAYRVSPGTQTVSSASVYTSLCALWAEFREQRPSDSKEYPQRCVLPAHSAK